MSCLAGGQCSSGNDGKLLCTGLCHVGSWIRNYLGWLRQRLELNENVSTLVPTLTPKNSLSAKPRPPTTFAPRSSDPGSAYLLVALSYPDNRAMSSSGPDEDPMLEIFLLNTYLRDTLLSRVKHQLNPKALSSAHYLAIRGAAAWPLGSRWWISVDQLMELLVRLYL